MATKWAKFPHANKAYAYAFSSPINDLDGVHLQIFELGCGP